MNHSDTPSDDTKSMQHDVPVGPSTASEQLATMPKQIGNYTLESIIGYGGMGVVYKALQKRPKRWVAIKVLRFELMTEQRLRRFEFEGELLGRLNHQCIAKVYEVGFFDAGQGRQPFIAMEYIEGQHLLHYNEQSKLSIEERLRLLVSICEGVAFAHQNGVVHRDLKPSNILITDERAIKILDFGVATAANVNMQVESMQTDVGQLVGTLPYMSPEQASGTAETVDSRSDIYSIGVIAYRMLCKKLPHNLYGLGIAEAVDTISQATPTLLGTYDRKLCGDIETIVAKALEKEKHRRYQTISALTEDIARYFASEPIKARPPSMLYVLSRFAKRNLVAVVAAMNVLVILILAIAYSQYKANEASAARNEALQRLDQIQHVASMLVFDLADRIGNLPGATPLREHIAFASQETLLSIGEEIGNNEELILELARTWQRLGDTFGNPHVPNLGKLPQAADAYARATKLLQRLESAPIVKWAGLHQCIADLLTEYGQTSGALELYKRARFEALESDELEADTLIASIDGRMAAIMHNNGNTNDAVEVLHKAVENLRVAQHEPRHDESSVLRELASLTMQLGILDRSLGRYTQSVALLKESKELLIELHRQFENDQVLYKLIATVETNLGVSLLVSDDVEQAIEVLSNAVQSHMKLAQSDPQNAVLQGLCAQANLQLGRALEVGAYYEAAIISCNQGIEYNQNSINLHRKRDNTYGLAKVLLLRSDIESKQGATEQSLATLLQAIEILEELHNENRSDLDVLVTYTTAKINRAVANRIVTGTPSIDTLLPSTELLEAEAIANPESHTVKQALVRAYNQLQKGYTEEGDFEAAMQICLKNVTLVHALRLVEPNTRHARRIEAVTLTSAGNLQAKRNRIDEAIHYFDQAATQFDDLLEEYPSNIRLLKNLFECLEGEISMLEQLVQVGTAREHDQLLLINMREKRAGTAHTINQLLLLKK